MHPAFHLFHLAADAGFDLGLHADGVSADLGGGGQGLLGRQTEVLKGVTDLCHASVGELVLPVGPLPGNPRLWSCLMRLSRSTSQIWELRRRRAT